MVNVMKLKLKRTYISNLLTRILLLIVFILFLLIINKYNHALALEFKNDLFNKSFNFIKINKISQKVLGKDVFYYQKNSDTSLVLSSNFDSNIKEKYYEGEKMNVSTNLPIGSISSGVVVYIGDKDNYGNTVIIQGVDGYNIWYGNIKDINVGLYDYVEKQNLIGAADGDFLYLLIEKDNKYYTYDEYKQNKD